MAALYAVMMSPVNQFLNATAPARGNWYNRNPQHVLELLHIDFHPAACQHVHHVQGDNHGTAKLG